MKTVSMQELKRDLSALVREAERGERILVVRHGKPAAALTAAGSEHTHVGPRFGRGSLRPLLRNATRGRYLAVLLEDRRADRDGR